MKKTALLWLMALTGTCYGQSLSYPNGKVNHSIIPGEFGDVPIYYKNITTLPVNIKWEKISASIKPGWELNFCNNGNCMPGVPDSGEWKNLQVNEEAFIKIHTLTNKIEGTSIVKFRIYALGDEVHADTLTFELVCNIAAGVSSPAVQSQVFLQAGSTLVIKEISAGMLQVFDLTGREIFTKTISVYSHIADLSQLPNGVYIVRLSAGARLLACRKISLSGN